MHRNAICINKNEKYLVNIPQSYSFKILKCNENYLILYCVIYFIHKRREKRYNRKEIYGKEIIFRMENM